ncbi:hypothetical protein BDZ94DRAFT_261882 [Collybia nuda]|uniref:Uncharacterized protein n=1 Tax=Collybia nuda TaxID=64659 RepID=A0A9P5XUC4_9AGAR|nr:hypothetical protein BDZ94DRAFT_261882 [Collybia nuda]
MDFDISLRPKDNIYLLQVLTAMSAQLNTLQDITRDEQAGIAHDNKIHRGVSPILLPEIPAPDLDLDLSSIIGSSNADVNSKVQKRASNVMKLSQENEKLKAELKAMSDRLEAAERRREELAKKEQETR